MDQNKSAKLSHKRENVHHVLDAPRGIDNRFSDCVESFESKLNREVSRESCPNTKHTHLTSGDTFEQEISVARGRRRRGRGRGRG